MKLFKDMVCSASAILIFFFIGLVIYVLTLMALNSARLFYDGLLAVFFILVVSYAGVGLLYKYIGHRMSDIEPQTLFAAAFAGAMLVYSFHITLPVIIDRSISLFVLSRMEGRNAGVSVEKLQESFLTGYVQNYSAVCRRLEEQVISGNIVFKDKKYYLAENGEYILKALRWIAFLVQRNNYYITDIEDEKSVYTYNIKNGQCVSE